MSESLFIAFEVVFSPVEYSMYMGMNIPRHVSGVNSIDKLDKVKDNSIVLMSYSDECK